MGVHFHNVKTIIGTVKVKTDAEPPTGEDSGCSGLVSFVSSVNTTDTGPIYFSNTPLNFYSSDIQTTDVGPITYGASPLNSTINSLSTED